MKGWQLIKLEKILMVLSMVTLIITLIFGFTYGAACKTPLFIHINYLAREYLAVIKSGLFD